MVATNEPIRVHHEDPVIELVDLLDLLAAKVLRAGVVMTAPVAQVVRLVPVTALVGQMAHHKVVADVLTAPHEAKANEAVVPMVPREAKAIEAVVLTVPREVMANETHVLTAHLVGSADSVAQAADRFVDSAIATAVV